MRLLSGQITEPFPNRTCRDQRSSRDNVRDFVLSPRNTSIGSWKLCPSVIVIDTDAEGTGGPQTQRMPVSGSVQSTSDDCGSYLLKLAGGHVMTTKRIAKLTDVAKLANVSLKTASRALNSEPYVAEETVAKVLRAAISLGYHPSSSEPQTRGACGLYRRRDRLAERSHSCRDLRDHHCACTRARV